MVATIKLGLLKSKYLPKSITVKRVKMPYVLVGPQPPGGHDVAPDCDMFMDANRNETGQF